MPIGRVYVRPHPHAHRVLRIFCHADRSPQGELALRYVDAIRDNGRAFSYVLVSLVMADLQAPIDPTTNKPQPKLPGWHHHAGRFLVDLKAPWTNVVIAPRVGPRQDWGSLYTLRVPNVLIAGDADPHPMAARYDRVAILDEEALPVWARVVDVERLRVVPPSNARALAELLTP